jgi:hypothetical protein
MSLKFSLMVLSILASLFYTLFEYYGGMRYIKLRTTENLESYISSYSSIDKHDKTRVVVSFFSSPGELKKLKPMLASLMDQTVRIDEISLCVPLNTRDEDIPDFVKKICLIYKIPNNTDGACILSTLMRERESDTDILFLKNNIIYGKDFIETVLYTKSDKNIIMGGDYILIKPDELDICDKSVDGTCKDVVKKYGKVPIDIVEYQENFKY